MVLKEICFNFYSRQCIGDVLPKWEKEDIKIIIVTCCCILVVFFPGVFSIFSIAVTQE